MKGHIVTSEVETELSVQVVLPNGEFKALSVLVDFGCSALVLANPNVFGDQISEKYESPQRRRLLQADNETPLAGGGGGEQLDVKIQFTGVVDGGVSLTRVAENGVSPYLVPKIAWDMVLGHPRGYKHCVSRFARFSCSYSHHPVRAYFWIEHFREAPQTGKPFLVRPIHGKVSRQSMWGVTVQIIGAVTPRHPAPAIVVTPPGGEPPNRFEADKHISYALTASSVAPYGIVHVRWTSLNLLPRLLPVMFCLHGVMHLCGSSLTMASRRIGAHVSKSNLAKTLTRTPSIGSQLWLRLFAGFRRSTSSFPPPRAHPNCI